MVKRIYIEKKKGFDAEADKLFAELKECLKPGGLSGVRILHRYDIEGINEEIYNRAKYAVFFDPAVETAYDEELPGDISPVFFAAAYLPGQYEQRADSAEKCIRMLDPQAGVTVSFAKIIALYGDMTESEVTAIKKYCINPVDSWEAQLSKPAALRINSARPENVKIIDGFTGLDKTGLSALKSLFGFAMSDDDIVFVQNYFKETEKRDPTITELRAIDTYWSDHCRHTTFMTKLTDIKFEKGAEVIEEAFGEYLKMRAEVYGGDERDICLMDIACIGAKYLKKKGLLDDLDESDEVNACCIKIKADADGKNEDWLLMFKNETHNHPTEIEPTGGASTCLGGAIRDPLSGRAYVYQAMRVTGAGDPRKTAADTLPGKLPQRKITTAAAEGYSSYGNQIGLAAGQATEIYDEGYIAKRMEMGALIGACPAEHVRRGKPVPGDVIILVGGRTGRDGCGGATSSSGGGSEGSAAGRGAEVPKGDPLTERNIVRLFRRKEATQLIRKCNDFGAGGVSVAVGELADSIDVNLDLIPVAYEGLDGTELAISESQERMAVLVSKEDKERFIAYACEENLEATAIAAVTDTGRFRLFFRGETILDLSREFLNTSGITPRAKVVVSKFAHPVKKPIGSPVESLSDLNCCSQKGLAEMFDSTIGAATVLMPLGGKYQLSPSPGMAAKLPLIDGETNTASLMAFGYSPEISSASPFHGAMYAVLESITKIVAMGGDISKIRLSFQEFFEKMKTPESWGKVFAALLGALSVQRELNIPSIGGKDSMSGTFMDLNVPPALVSFAVDITDANKVISAELKKHNSKIILVNAKYDKDGIPDFAMYKDAMNRISLLAGQGKILAANTVGTGGIFISLVKMAVGNKIGFKIKNMEEELIEPDHTAVILEIPESENIDELFCGVQYEALGVTTGNKTLVAEGMISIGIEEVIKKWTAPLEGVFPVRAQDFKKEKDDTYVEKVTYDIRLKSSPVIKTAKPKVLIPVLPGTICEYDCKRAFEKAGAEVDLYILRNLNAEMFLDSVAGFARMIRKSQIVMLAGGTSGGGDPGGPAKFTAAVFRNEIVREAVNDLMESRDGLILGTGSGFNALLKLGLLSFGKITETDEAGVTLAQNKIGRHMSRIVRTRVASVKSPWFAGVSAGDIHSVAISSGYGRFTASDEQIAGLIRNGQIAAQYVDFDGSPSLDIDFNPGYSVGAVEAVTSPDGRIMGKLGHPERIGNNIYKNVPGDYDQKIFESGVRYFNY